MNKHALDLALEEWSKALPELSILLQGEEGHLFYNSTVSGWTRSIPAVLKPTTTADVLEIIKIARQFKVSIYPYSTGKNWGLGTRLPVSESSILLDLSGLNKIIEVNEEEAYAVIEPGVTQGQLYNFLEENHPSLMLNVTGSGLETGFIGNALERGVGYFSSRVHEVSGLEIITGSGEFLNTGWRGQAHIACEKTYVHGLGPQLDGLFFQSNFGVVVSAVVKLLRKPEAHFSVLMYKNENDSLEDFLQPIIDLKREGVISHVPHVADKERSNITIAPRIFDIFQEEGLTATTEKVNQFLESKSSAEWTAVIGLTGSLGKIKSDLKQIKKRCHRSKIKVINLDKLDGLRRVAKCLSRIPSIKKEHMYLEAAMPFIGLSKGIPTNEALKCVAWAAGNYPDGYVEGAPETGNNGMIYILPFAPLKAASSENMTSIVYTVCETYSLRPAITLNMVDAWNIEAVISIHFDLADAERVKQAHECHKELVFKLKEAGFWPYRLGVEDMKNFVDETDPHWQWVSRLKDVFDPDGIISPGRYCLK